VRRFVKLDWKSEPPCPQAMLMADFILSARDDELRRKAVVIGAKAHDVDLSHSGPQVSEKRGLEHEYDSRLCSATISRILERFAVDQASRLLVGINSIEACDIDRVMLLPAPGRPEEGKTPHILQK
jgi:hypothetical protein